MFCPTHKNTELMVKIVSVVKDGEVIEARVKYCPHCNFESQE